MRKYVMAAGIISSLIAGTQVASAAVYPQSDPERNSTAEIPWGSLTGASPDAINAFAKSNNSRVIDVEVDGTSSFTVQTVRNTGVYARGVTAEQSWVYGLSYQELLSKLINEHKRPLDVERYKTTSGDIKFAAALVDNPEWNYHEYRFYTNKTPQDIASALASFNGRIIDLEPVGNGRYDVVAIKNSGVDAAAWGWYLAQTPAEIQAILARDKSRLVSLEPDGDGRFAIVLAPADGKSWWYALNTDQKSIGDIQKQTGGRPIQVKRYWVSGQEKYLAIFIDDQPIVSSTIRDAMGSVAQDSAYGFYLKRVDGGVINSINADKVMDPGSGAKTLVHLTNMLKVRAGTGGALGDYMKYYVHPDSPADITRCAYDSNGNKLTSMPKDDTVFAVSRGMMQASDNRMTDALLDRVGGFDAVNGTASKLGMWNTKYQVRLGCGEKVPGQLGDRNNFTLTDMGKMYESVYRHDNPILGTGTDRVNFEKAMVQARNMLKPVIDEEAAALGKSDVAYSFYAAVNGVVKAGHDTHNGLNAKCDLSGCSNWVVRRAAAGWISIPFKSSTGAPADQQFVHGEFFDGDFDCDGIEMCPADAPNLEKVEKARIDAFLELMRPQIREALKTW